MATETGWSTLQPGLPETITSLATAVDTLVEALLVILDLARAVLNVVQAFMVGLIDPITAIIDAIIAEIEGLLSDIRQVGVYFAGDLYVEPPFEALLGGFAAYERRMVGRLIDRTDPTRPSFTSRTTVVAVFLYASFDVTTLRQVTAFLSLVRQFFGLPGRTRAYTIPVGLAVTYGSTSTGLGAFGQLSDIFQKGEDPTVANLRWQMAPPAGATGTSWPVPAPPGFLVEVSTIPDGLFLAYQTPVSQAQADDAGAQRQVVGLMADPDGSPFKLYGGAGILAVQEDLHWSQDGTTYTPPEGDGATRAFAYLSAADNTPVPLNALVVDGKYVLQKTFFVDVAALGIQAVAPGQSFSATLAHADMPYEATFEDGGGGKVLVTLSEEPAREVYVRVSAVTGDVIAQEGEQASTFNWVINQSRVVAGAPSGVRLGVAEGIPVAAKGDSSSAVKVTFPNTTVSEYVEAVATALAVMVLSRADLIAQGTSDVSFQVDVAGEATGLEDLARYLVPLVVGPSPSRFFKRQYPDVASFRGALRQRCVAVANNLLQKTGPLSPSLLDLVLGRAVVTTRAGERALSAVTWSDLAPSYGGAETILASMDVATVEGADPAQGVGSNPVSVGNKSALVLETRVGSVDVDLARLPGFLVPDTFVSAVEPTGKYAPINTGSADYSPVLYVVDGPNITMDFCRNVFLSNPTIFSAAATVLGVASAPLTSRELGGGAWTSYRLFPQGMPPVEAALGEITGFLGAIRTGLQGILDTALAYVSLLEARILELEALLRRIQGLLDLTLSIQVPAASGLVVTAAGTDGILEALVGAADKPSDSAQVISRIDADGNTVVEGTYGAGVVLLAGGLPTTVLELLLLLFPPSEA